jgi:hypothetical protein
MTTPDWYDAPTQTTTRELRLQTDAGEVVIPAGFKTDIFTAVPDTRYEQFWLAAVLHDYLLDQLHKGHPVKGCETRSKCDDAFYSEMVFQSVQVYTALYPTIGKRAAIKELKQLIKISEVYYLGVTAFGWFWNWWNKKK